VTDSVGFSECGTGASTQGLITYLRWVVLTLVPIPKHGWRIPQWGNDPTFGEVTPESFFLASSCGFRP
jgi:hypothetical protein